MADNVQLSAAGPLVRKTPRHTRRAANHLLLQRLSIIIPCYNEAATIAILLDKIADAHLPGGIEKEIIVINDCSQDDTELMIQEYVEDNPDVAITYIRHPFNKGKGAAVQTGIQSATGDYLLIQDADLEYNPKEYALMLEPILSGDADVVYGSRFMGGNPHRILFFWHTLGNKLLTFISNLLTNMNLTDAHTCFKLIRTSTIRSLGLREQRFAFDAELNVKVARLPGIRVYEVGISYYGRTFAEGKKIRLRDAFRTVYCLVKYSVLYRRPVPLDQPVAVESIPQ